MNKTQERILDEIRKNPYISQQTLADLIGLSRSAIANLIKGLTDEGYITGRAYILNEERGHLIVCVGGANLDTKLILSEDLQLGTSNPAQSKHSLGGVVRNVAENLGRLSQSVTLLTLVGNDMAGRQILEECHPLMDVSRVQTLDGYSTGSYLAVLSPNGEMSLGLADMNIIEKMDPEWMISNQSVIAGAHFIVVDNNLRKDTMENLFNQCLLLNKKLILIGVSAPKTKRLPERLDGVYLTIFNLDESQAYFHSTETDPMVFAKRWIEAGSKHAIVTNGANSVAYASYDQEPRLKRVKPAKYIVDATGAGDAFSSGVIYALNQNMSLEDALDYGLANANQTIQSIHSVRKELNEAQLQQDKEDYIQ